MSEVYLSDYENHLAQLKAHLSGKTSESLPPAFIPPAGYWTSREKDTFFHALTIHSRLRPDLIAASVKSKTILDVCAYLDALDRAAASEPILSQRATLEGAMEVSDSWVDYEEAQASELMEVEPGWEEEVKEHKRAELLTNRFRDDPAYWSWKDEQESLWRKQDNLVHLSLPHLSVMERLLQKSDATGETLDSVRQTPEPALEPLPTPESRDGVIQITPQHVPSLDATEPDQGPSGSADNRSASVTPALPASPPPSHIPPSADYFRALSPASRRRLKKRLSMRKARAEARGTVPNLLPIILPSHTKTKIYVPKPRPHTYKKRHKKPDVEEEANDRDDGEIAATGQREGGLDPEAKIQQIFQDQGIDGNTLVQWGLDVFNMRKLGKLMGLFDRAYGDSDQKSTISVNTIEILRNILLDFTSTIVQSAISIREQEVVLKRNMKIWRLQKEDKITPANIHDALMMHGFNRQNLLTDFPKDVPKDPSPDDGENDDERPEQRFVEGECTFHARLPLHRELASFVFRPEFFEDNSLLSPETNMDELDAELDDELVLDERDCQLEAQYEKELWEAVAG
ncbi:hypothetical protein MSAN_00031400 [Mycena sanguinolenta]|uniref:Uncharacterized protein n=1 Tax=Mycena sanguinolenta TaxID=230812 RepID=A0A8H6ZC05_9AGAR|nr:hypothetical protein MSAN_00031400 [Mycena sanguinolenta]